MDRNTHESTPIPRPPDEDGGEDLESAAAPPPRRLLDRISEAVRAAHAAAVPF